MLQAVMVPVNNQPDLPGWHDASYLCVVPRYAQQAVVTART
jgi:hypothetical protein